jgi:hypothetical protein
MTQLLERAGASFLRAFGAALIVLFPGVLAAPDLNGAKALAVAALFGSLTAGLRALQEFIPSLTFAQFVPQPYAAWVDSFVRGFLGAFITTIIGLFVAPDLNTMRAAVTAALVGALTAGLRALQGAITRGESPAPSTGITPAGVNE